MNNQCCPPNVFTLSTGDDGLMYLSAVYAQNYTPLDLTNCTAISVNLPNADGSTLSLTLADGAVAITSPPVLGSFTAVITEAQSTLLMVGELQSFAVVFTISGKVQTVWYPNALTVTQQ
jgi:hypothetical protein